MKHLKNKSRIIALMLSLALLLNLFAVMPMAVSAETDVPGKPADTTDYADSITGFGQSCYGVGATDMPAWNTTTKGAAFPDNAWGATLAQGYSVSPDKEAYISVNVLPAAVDSNYGIVFRSASFGNPGSWINTDIFSVFVSNTAVTVRKYFLNGDASWGSSDDVVASASYSRSAVATENVVIKSNGSAVSVWVGGVKYIDEAAISASTYNPVVGFWFPDITVSDVSFWAQDPPSEPVPTKPAGNIDYIAQVSGWNGPYWAQGNADYQPAWNDATNGFTVDKPGNGALVTTGYNVPQSKTAVLSVDLSDYSGGRTDIIFRGTSCTDYWAAYIYPDGTGFLSHVVNTVEQVNFANFTFTPAVSGTDTVVIRSGSGKVSVWINGVEVVKNYAQTIDTVNYAASFGVNTSVGVPATLSNASLFCLEEDLLLGEPVPTKPADNTNYLTLVNGWNGPYWAQGNAEYQPTWNAQSMGFTLDKPGNGALVTSGYTLSAAKETILSVDISDHSTDRVDLIFRGASCADYWAAYIYPNGTGFLSHVVNCIEQVNFANFTYTPDDSGTDTVVIRSGNNKVSLWINDEQLLRDYTDNVSITNYTPSFGVTSPIACTFSNAQLFVTEIENPLNQPVPTRIDGNVNYADYISGFGDSMWGLPAADVNAAAPWSSADHGFVMESGFGNGAFLANGSVPANDKEVVLETTMTVSSNERQDIIFRASSNMDYYALYVWNNSVALYHYSYFGGGDLLVANTNVPYTRAAGDRFVIRSGDGKVSVWINGTQYFRDEAINTTAFAPKFGVTTGWSGSNYSLTFADTDIYRTDIDPVMNDAVPTMPNGNINYADKITSFSIAAWSDPDNESTLPVNYVTRTEDGFYQTNHFAYGAYLATGYEIDSTKPYVLDVDVTSSRIADGRVDLIFRALSYGDYYAVYLGAHSVNLYKWTPAGDELIASSYIPYTRPASGTSNVVVLSTQSSVSVWIDGTQYLKDIEISGGYSPVVGLSNCDYTDNTDSVTLSNLKMYLNQPDYDMTYAPTSDVYLVGEGTISAVAPDTTVSDFRENLVTSSSIYTYKIFDRNVEVTGGLIATGMQVKIYVNGVPEEGIYTIAVRGDLDGDGLIAAGDVVKAKQHILGSETLSGAYLKAADVYNTESPCDVRTVVWLKKAIAGLVDPADPQYASTYTENQFKVAAYTDLYHLNNPSAVFGALKNANVDLVIPENLPYNQTAEDYAAVLQAAESTGIDYMVDMAAMTDRNHLAYRDSEIASLTAQFKNAQHAYGYYLQDEPSVTQFRDLRIVNSLLTKYDPSSLSLSCLLPSYSGYKWNGAGTSFDEYVDKFIDIAKPQILANDYYLYTTSSTPNLNTYDLWKDMGYLRKKSVETGLPYWHVFQGVTDFDYGTTANMTLAKYSVQMKAALAYGCKGAAYFTAVETFCDTNGNVSSFYNDLAGLNTQVQRIGNLIYNAQPIEIYHPRLDSSYTAEYFLSDVANSAIISGFSTVSSRNRNTVCSVFEDAGNYYLLILNKSVDSSASYNISLKKSSSVRAFNVGANAFETANSTSTVSGTVGAGDLAVYAIQK